MFVHTSAPVADALNILRRLAQGSHRRLLNTVLLLHITKGVVGIHWEPAVFAPAVFRGAAIIFLGPMAAPVPASLYKISTMAGRDQTRGIAVSLCACQNRE